jgi:Tfp pilus assembly protein PilF
MHNLFLSKILKLSTTRLIFIFVLVLIAYFPTFFNGFTNWDDLKQVTENADITSLSFHHIKTFFSSFYVGMYQPFATFCFAVIYKFFGLKAIAYHLFSLLLHLINVLLVYKIIRKLTAKTEIIFFVTLLFAVNPMQTEAVAWVSATSTLLYSMFFLLSANVYLNFIKSENKQWSYYISILLFILALLAKSAAVTLPLVLLLFDYFTHSKISKKDLINKIPFFVLSLIFGIITIIARKEAGHIINITKYYSIFERTLLITYSLSYYIISVFAPLKMSAFHPYPDKPGGMLPVLYFLAPLFLVAIAILLIKAKRFRKEIIFGILFFLFSISVMIELIPVGIQLVKERYTYIPCIGLYFVFFSFLSVAFEKKEKIKHNISYGIIALSVVFVVFSFIRTQTWKNSFSLWNDVIAKYPTCSAAFINRGNAYIGAGDYDQAIADLNNAIKFEPNAADAYMNRAIARSNMNDIYGAIKDYDKAIIIGPVNDKMYMERAALKSGIGDITGAINDISNAIKLNPNDKKYYNQRGIFYGMNSLFKNAIADFTSAIAIDKDYPDAWSNRGYAKVSIYDYNGAIEDLTTALKINPNSAQTYYVRGIAESQANRDDLSCADFRKAYELGWTAAEDKIKQVCGK